MMMQEWSFEEWFLWQNFENFLKQERAWMENPSQNFEYNSGKFIFFKITMTKCFCLQKKFLLNVLRHPRPILRVLFFLWLELMIEQENLWRKIFPTESLEKPNNIHCFQEHNEAGKKTVKNISWEIFSKNSRKSPFPRIAWKRKTIEETLYDRFSKTEPQNSFPENTSSGKMSKKLTLPLGTKFPQILFAQTWWNRKIRWRIFLSQNFRKKPGRNLCV